MINVPSIKNPLLDSALTTDFHINSNIYIEEWIQKHRQTSFKTEQIPLNLLKKWRIDDGGNFRHDSDKFFSITGLEINTDWGEISHWQQPIINQPEVGILGIIAKQIEGKLHFLMQAKKEPGNINGVQISPTLQATKSNFKRAHKGKQPPYLKYFLNPENEHVILDQLQSEQGGRFYRKRNRNIIIQITDDIEIYDNYIWMTLGQIQLLLKKDNLVNMDTRSVLSAISYYDDDLSNLDIPVKNTILLDSFYEKIEFNEHTKDILMWLTNLKSSYDFDVIMKPLNHVKNWIYDRNEIYHEERKFFSIIGIHSFIGNREVMSWDQPMMQPCQEGVIGFIIKPINGVLHFLVQAKLEVGNIDIFELAPTVQTLTGNFKEDKKVPFLDNIIKSEPSKILSKTMQSEEGGRFYREQNLNIIILEKEDFKPDLPVNFRWIPLSQILLFLKFNNYFNMSARSLISQLNLEKND